LERNVVLVKTNPVKEYMYEIIQEVFKPFIDAGVMRVIKGGRSLCTYAAHRPLVDNLHMTGSDRTFNAIVYGNGEEGTKNKKKDHKILHIPMTGELGCVTPIIIVPGKWSESQFHYQAKNIVTMLGFNSGFSCCAPRVLIMPKGWDGSLKLMNLIRDYMKKMYISSNYYPGTNEVVQFLENKYPTLEKIGPCDERHQPWMLVADIDPEQDRNQDEYLFHTEIWAAFMCQVYLSCKNVDSYLMAAVEFANTKLWGNLSAMIIIDKKTQRTLEKTGTLAKAIRKLCYGNVSINIFSGYANGLSLLPWGGYPTSSYTDIQSGNIYINNIMMLKNVEKSVLWAPFYLWPEPPLFITHKKVMQTAVMFSRYNVTGRFIDFLKTMATVVGLMNPRI
jgi:acyl-CoA reductase-like NAD-dependent aldehyde dehydrogenase